MSEEGAEPGGASTPDAMSQGPTNPTEAAATTQARPADAGLFNLWMKAGGWFVMSIGVITILLALRGSYERGIPFLLLVGLVMIGVAYVLAGQGMTEGYAWPLPLGVLACVISPLGILADLLLVIAAVCFYRLVQQYSPEGALNRNVTPRASLAFGLWIGGITLIALVIIFYAGGH